MSNHDIMTALHTELRQQKLKYRSMDFLANRHAADLKRSAKVGDFAQIEIHTRMYSEFCKEKHVCDVEIHRLEKEIKSWEKKPIRFANIFKKLKMRLTL
jgi:pyridoxine 5'-phosphate synthase PdxJ